MFYSCESARLGATSTLFNAFTMGNPFGGINLLEVSIGRDFVALKGLRCTHVCRDKGLGINVGHGFAQFQGGEKNYQLVIAGGTPI